MNKKNISSIELAALVNELQFLAQGKIDQIYHEERRELLLQIHLPRQGKQLLRIIPGKFLNLTKNKSPFLRPSRLCMLLRKYLDHASIISIQQHEAERIAVLELEKEHNYFLIFELFSKGNIVLTDHNYKIIGVWQEQIWKDRAVKEKETYLFPKSINWKAISEQELQKLLAKSDKKNIVTFLATELGVGGTYAEEICSRTHLDKTKAPADLKSKEIQLILKTLKDLMDVIKEPLGYIYELDITALPLTNQNPVRIAKTYNEALDTLNPFVTISPYEKKIKSLERTIADQEETLQKHRENIELNKKKGELVYEHYMKLQQLLEIVKELRKEKDWQEIEKELKKEKKIKKVDLKEKKVVIEL